MSIGSLAVRRVATGALALSLSTFMAGCADGGRISSPAPTTTTTTTSATQSQSITAAENAVREWVDDLAANDVERSWASLGPASRQVVGDIEALQTRMGALQAGFGGWAAASDLLVKATPVSVPPSVGTLPIGTDLLVVELQGKRSFEGPIQFAAASIPVFVTGNDVDLEPFTSRPVVFDPPAGSSIGASHSFSVDLPADVPDDVEVRMLIDNGHPVSPVFTTGSAGSRKAAYAPAQPLAPVDHVFTVVLLWSAPPPTNGLDPSRSISVSSESVGYKAG